MCGHASACDEYTHLHLHKSLFSQKFYFTLQEILFFLLLDRSIETFFDVLLPGNSSSFKLNVKDMVIFLVKIVVGISGNNANDKIKK